MSPLHDGLQLLEWLSDHPQAQGVTVVAQAFGWPKSRAHRVLATLLTAGYVVQDPDRRYRATPQVLRLASGVMSNTPIRTLALPVLRQAAQITGGDAILSVLHGDRSLAIAVDSPAGRLSEDPFDVLGRTAHLHAAANGKVLLAWLPLVEQRQVLDRLPMSRLTARTITDRASLEAELEQVRAQGFARNDRENHPDTVTISVPVFDGFHRAVAAMGLSQRPGVLKQAQVVAVLKKSSAGLSRAIAGV
jgi:DNA-binding IclR family transcriptional regulator